MRDLVMPSLFTGMDDTDMIGMDILLGNAGRRAREVYGPASDVAKDMATLTIDLMSAAFANRVVLPGSED